MKRSDIGFSIMMYAIMALFLIPLLSYPSAVRIYPMLILILYFLLTTAYLLAQLRNYKRSGIKHNDFKEIFEGFLPRQILIIAGLILLYFLLIPRLGFYVTTGLFMLATMLYLKVPVKHIVISLVVFFALLYGVFTLFLNVPLPTGLLM